MLQLKSCLLHAPLSNKEKKFNIKSCKNKNKTAEATKQLWSQNLNFNALKLIPQRRITSATCWLETMPPPPTHHFPVPWPRAAGAALPGCRDRHTAISGTAWAAERWGWGGKFGVKWMSTADHHHRWWQHWSHSSCKHTFQSEQKAHWQPLSAFHSANTLGSKKEKPS